MDAVIVSAPTPTVQRDLKTLCLARCFLKWGIILRQEVRGFLHKLVSERITANPSEYCQVFSGYGWPSALLASMMNIDNNVLKSSRLATSKKLSGHFSSKSSVVGYNCCLNVPMKWTNIPCYQRETAHLDLTQGAFYNVPRTRR